MTDKFAAFVAGDVRPPPLGDADGLVIRRARRADVPEAAAIAAAREGEPAERWIALFESVLRRSASGRSLLLVALLRERVIGYGKAARFTPRRGSPANTAPEGWYLTGVIVHPDYRRRGVGSRLTQARLAWIGERSGTAYYVANERNRVSIELHRALGFRELTRDFHHPRVRFEGGAGILFIRHRPEP